MEKGVNFANRSASKVLISPLFICLALSLCWRVRILDRVRQNRMKSWPRYLKMYMRACTFAKFLQSAQFVTSYHSIEGGVERILRRQFFDFFSGTISVTPKKMASFRKP